MKRGISMPGRPKLCTGPESIFSMRRSCPPCRSRKAWPAAMGSTGLPCLFSFTLRRDGRLPDGTALSDAICRVDEACARAGCKAPLCYMTNCVHPRLVREALLRPFNRTDAVQRRFRGIQANASPLDMEVLDGADGTVTSPPEEWAQEMGRAAGYHGCEHMGRLLRYGWQTSCRTGRAGASSG